QARVSPPCRGVALPPHSPRPPSPLSRYSSRLLLDGVEALALWAGYLVRHPPGSQGKHGSPLPPLPPQRPSPLDTLSVIGLSLNTPLRPEWQSRQESAVPFLRPAPCHHCEQSHSLSSFTAVSDRFPFP